MGYTLINRDDPSIESFRGAFFKIRRALGTTAIGINEIRFPPGIECPEHDELDTGHEEICTLCSRAPARSRSTARPFPSLSVTTFVSTQTPGAKPEPAPTG